MTTTESLIEEIKQATIQEFGKELNPKTKRYIGETMLNVLAQLTKLQEKSFLSVPYPEPDAVGFYKKCHFIPTGNRREVVLPKKDVDKLEKTNFEHTNSSVDFIV